MYLSYSGHKSYASCPKQYWHRYIDNTPSPVAENGVNALYGSVVGILFEWFYARHLWMQKGVEEHLLSMVDETLEATMTKEGDRGRIFNFAEKASNYKTKEALLADIRETIPRGIQIIRQHRLLGPDAAAEVKLDSWIQGHRIGGRADFAMTRIKPHQDKIILDGKGSRHLTKYVDPWQLKWYAMLWREKFTTAPDKLGFLLWRAEPDDSIQWVPFTRNELDELRDSVVQTAQKIDEGKALLTSAPQMEAPQVVLQHFPAAPSSECRFCVHLTQCPPGQAYESAALPVAISGLVGVDDVGLDV